MTTIDAQGERPVFSSSCAKRNRIAAVAFHKDHGAMRAHESMKPVAFGVEHARAGARDEQRRTSDGLPCANPRIYEPGNFFSPRSRKAREFLSETNIALRFRRRHCTCSQLNDPRGSPSGKMPITLCGFQSQRTPNRKIAYE
jgi:hypothetical protein